MDAILNDFREQFGRLRLTEQERTAIQRQTEAALGRILLGAQASRAAGAATGSGGEAASEYHPTRQQVQAWTAVSAQAAAGATKREGQLHAVEILIADKLRQLGRSVAAHFVKFDYTGNGMLTAEEFSFAIAGLGLSVSDSEARAVCSRYDTSGDGTIDFAEFVSAISSINPSQTEVSAAIAQLPVISASSIPAAGRRGPDHASHDGHQIGIASTHGPAVTSLSTVPSLTSAERVMELRRAAGSKLLRRHKSVSAVWRAAHRASVGSRSPGPDHQVQSGVTVDALAQLLRSEGMDCSADDLSIAARPFLSDGTTTLSMRGLSLFLGDGTSARTSAAADVGRESAAGLEADRPGLARVVSGGARDATNFEPMAVTKAVASGGSGTVSTPPSSRRSGLSRMAGRTMADDRSKEAARTAASSASSALAPDEMCAGMVGSAMRAAKLSLLRRALKHQDRANIGRLTASQLHNALMMVAAAAGGDAGQLGRITLADCEATVRARGAGGEIEATALSAIIAGTPAAAAARARGPQPAITTTTQPHARRTVPPPVLPPATAGSPLQAQRSARKGAPPLGTVSSSPVMARREASATSGGFKPKPESSPLTSVTKTRTAPAAAPVVAAPVAAGDWRKAHVSVADAVATQARGARYVHTACDRESFGAISAKDMCAKMKRFGCELTEGDAIALVTKFDRTGDGRLTMSEFVSMLSASTA